MVSTTEEFCAKMPRIGGKRWIVPSIAALIMVFLVAPIAHADGVLWTGIDPIFKVNNHTFNIWVEWPAEYTCTIGEPIDVRVRAPKDSSYVFIAESSDDVGDCGSPQRTLTKVTFDNRADDVGVRARVRSGLDFPVRVKVFLDGELVSTRMGVSNRWTTDATMKLTNEDYHEYEDFLQYDLLTAAQDSF